MIVHRCGCCRREFSATEWAALHLKGKQVIEADDEGPADVLELRDCLCGSTIAVSQLRLTELRACGPGKSNGGYFNCAEKRLTAENPARRLTTSKPERDA